MIKTLSFLHKNLINDGKKYNENKYKLFFICYILRILNNSAEIYNYMIIDIDFSFLHTETYWLSNFRESDILYITLFLDKPIYKDLIDELNNILSAKTYYLYETTLLQFYKLFNRNNIHYTRHNIHSILAECINTNENFNLFINAFYTFSINKLFNNIYVIWFTNIKKYIHDRNENQKLYALLQKIIYSNQINFNYIPDLQNISSNSYLDYSTKWSHEFYINYYKLLEKYYNDLNHNIQIIPKPKKKYIPASIKEIVWNKRANSNGAVQCELCNKILSPHTCHYSHYISEKNGGTIHPDNLTILCQSCNLSMGSKNFNEFTNTFHHNITL